MPSLKVKRGTRAQLNTAATANGLKEGEPYLITDESRIAIGLSASTFDSAAKFSEIGSSLLFGTTLADGTTLTVAAHGNRRLPVNGGTINLPADASWPTDVTFEFVSVGTTPTVINWAGNAIVSQDTGSAVSQVIGGALTATAIVTKMSSGVAYIYSGTARGIDAIAVTLGTNPNTPAVGATAVYNFVSAAGLALEGLYRFSGVVGPFRVAAIAGNAVTLENVSATVGASVPAGTKLAPTGIKGDAGAAGATGTNAIAVTSGTNPVTPGVGLTADYVMVSSSGLIISGTYQFSGVTGTFTLTAIAGNTVTLQNVNATVGATIASGTRLAPAGTPGAAGSSGTSGIATIAGTPPVTPGVGLTVTYTVDSSAGLILQAYYALTGIIGTFQLTNIVSATSITLTNINATVGATVSAGTRIGAAAREFASTVAYEGGIDYRIAPSNTNAIAVLGGAAPTTSGTISTPALATTNSLASTSRSVLTGAATAGTLVFIRSARLMCWRGNAANRGGFRFVTRMGLDTLVAGNRGFAGLADNGWSTPTNVDPLTSTASGRIGIGFADNTGNWRLITATNGLTPTVTDLGTSFPLNQTDTIELVLFCLPNAAGISWTVTNFATGASTGGTITTNLPANTSFLAPITWMTNNATALAFAFAHATSRLTTPY